MKRLGFVVILFLSVCLFLPKSAHAATFTVTNTNDAGAGSLRQAIIDANAAGGADIIDFSHGGGTITLTSSLPDITGSTTISGETASGRMTIDATATTNCLRFDTIAVGTVTGITCYNAVGAGIVFSNVTSFTVGGIGVGQNVIVTEAGTDGLSVTSSSGTILNSAFHTNFEEGIEFFDVTNTTIGNGTSGGKNLLYSNFGHGLSTAGASSNITIDFNYFGTADGTTAAGNAGNGVALSGTSSSITAKNNIVLANANGFVVFGSGSNTFESNYVGIDASGNNRGNVLHAFYVDSGNNMIGGTTSNKGNFMSGNGGAGVLFGWGADSQNNTVQNNTIGLNLDETAAVGNNWGIYIANGWGSNNDILDNVISGNTTQGIIIDAGANGTTIYGNTIGLNGAGTAAIPNGSEGIRIVGSNSTLIGEGDTVSARNIISGNTGVGIYLESADSSVIEGNYIGVMANGTTSATNAGGSAIQLATGTDNNIIGGSTSGTGNTIKGADGQSGVLIEGGNGNTVRRNIFKAGSYTFMTRSGTANESIAVPTISSASGSAVAGTSVASATIDVYQDGVWIASGTATGGGSYSIAETYSGTTAYVTQTNGSGSTSAMASTAFVYNQAPTVASVTAVQGTDGTGDVTITFIMDDPDDDNTLQAKIEYSLNGGSSWADPTISTTGSETFATYGDPSVNNAVTYQVGQAGAYITTSSGANTVSIMWEAATDVSSSTDIANAKIRVTPYDSLVEGTAASSSNFDLDLVDPTGLAGLSMGDVSTVSAILLWTAGADTNFNHYEIWYASVSSDATNRTGGAVEWDNSDDADLATAGTTTTTVSGNLRNKYVAIFAVDDGGNDATTTVLRIPSGSSSSSSSNGSNGSPTYSIIVTSPTSGASYSEGESITISWSTGGSGISSFIDLYSTTDGVLYDSIAQHVNAYAGSYTWVPSGVSGSTVQVRADVTDLLNVLATDLSDTFTIAGGDDEVGVADDIPDGSYIRGVSWPAVYRINGSVRQPFLDSQTYFTYEIDFDSVIVVEDDVLARYSMGAPMLPKPEIVLMKIQSMPNVYAMDADGVSHWVISEDVAADVYGSQWADYVIDIPVTAWRHFTFGDVITSADDIDVNMDVMKTREEVNA